MKPYIFSDFSGVGGSGPPVYPPPLDPRMFQITNFKTLISTEDAHIGFVCLLVFVALRPKSTAMVIAGRSVHLTTLFPGQAWTSS